jgi:hypothetical protein
MHIYFEVVKETKSNLGLNTSHVCHPRQKTIVDIWLVSLEYNTRQYLVKTGRLWAPAPGKRKITSPSVGLNDEAALRLR